MQIITALTTNTQKLPKIIFGISLLSLTIIYLINNNDNIRLAINTLEHPEKLEEMRSRLRAVRGQPGAAQKLAQLVQEALD
jgi:hypothetical protein